MKRVRIGFAVLLIASLLLSLYVSAQPVTTEIISANTVQVEGFTYVKTESGVAAQRITVSGGNFVGLVIPSWYIGTVNIYVVVYKWNSSYAETVAATPIFTDNVQASSVGVWQDPGMSDMTVDFERAFAPGEYLVQYINNNGDALYVPTVERVAGTAAFFNHEELEGVSYRMSYIVDSAATLNEEPNNKFDVKSADTMIAMYGTGASNDGMSYVPLNGADTIAMKFTVSRGVLTGIVINSFFQTTDVAEIQLSLYKWNNDYTATVGGGPVYTNTFSVDYDAAAGYYNLILDFGEYRFEQGTYLVALSTYDGVNLWTHAPQKDIVAYIDDEEYTDGTYKLSYTINDDETVNEPDPSAATPTPVVTPTPDVTATPDSSDATQSAATATATATTNTNTDNNQGGNGDTDNDEGGNTALIIAGVIAGVVIIAVIIFVVMRKRGK